MIDFSTYNPALALRCDGCLTGFPTKLYRMPKIVGGMIHDSWLCFECLRKGNLLSGDTPTRSELTRNNRRWQDDIRSRILAPDGRTVLRTKRF